MAFGRLPRAVKYILYAALGAALLWLLLKYALPWLLPFLIALVVARIMEPAVAYLTGTLNFRRCFASAVCAALFLAVIVSLIVLLVWRASYELTAFVRQLPSLLSGTSAVVSSLEEKLYGWTVSAPPEIQEYIKNVLKSFSERSAALPTALSGKLLAAVTSAAACAPKLTLFSVTCAIAIFFVSSRYHDMTAFFARQLPPERRAALRSLSSDLRETLGGWLRAQLILCGITAAELAAAFFLLGIDYAILLALLVALIDALPVIGSGTVLLPWALTALISGNTGRAAVLAVTYAVVTIVRGSLEPRLVGAGTGVPPLATLAAIYIGFCAMGVPGMLLFPVALIVIKQLNDRGTITLWK